MLIIAILGALLVLLVLWDAFETIVVPKTVQRRVRVSTIYAHIIWRSWHGIVDRVRDGGFRTALLSSFGPLSLIFLFVTWAGVLVIAFALVHFGISDLPEGSSLAEYLYFSGTTFFTLGLGDMAPAAGPGRFLTVTEAGTGFGFLAIVIAYIPILYQAFQRRERLIVQLDSRAGSEPTAGELIKRHADTGAVTSLTSFLREAENWSAEQLETYLSYPIFAYYRSQHESQSWLKTATAILDACAVIMVAFPGEEPWKKELRFQAKATFAMTRHVIVDLSYILDDPPASKPPSRLGTEDEIVLAEIVKNAGGNPEGMFERLAKYRSQYEPFLVGLARDLHLTLPAWVGESSKPDNWQLSAWSTDDHF